MIHAYLRRQLSQYLDGTLAAPESARMQRHLATCASCRSELAELRGTVALLRSLASEEPPADLAERVLARVGDLPSPPTRFETLRDGMRRMLGTSWAPAFASVAVLVVAAALLRVEVEVRLPFGEPPRLADAAPAPFEAAPQRQSPEAVSLTRVALGAPLDARRRFDPISLSHASGLRRACLASPNDVQCHRFHQDMMVLAVEDPPAFIEEVVSVPSAPRERLLSVLSSEAARSGSAARIVSRLRAVDDPRAVGIVVRFERPVASRD